MIGPYTIQIQRTTTTINAAGSPVQTWADHVTLRAELVDASTEEAQRAGGTGDERPATFRTRYVDGITPADRLHFRGRIYEIKAVEEIGRRRVLQIRAIAKGV